MTNLLHENSHSSVWYDPVKNELIKALNESYPSETDLQKLRNEFEHLQELKIEGVRKALGFTRENNQPRLHLEYIEGQNLRDFFKSHTLTLYDQLSLLIQLCNILHQVHQEGVIHKDVNPSNILVSNNKQVYLIDFEIASRFTLRRPNLGNPEKLEGTLRYISPEQTGRMNRSVDYRTDLYSLGASLFELLTGEAPFQEDNALNLVYAHLAKTPPYPSEIKESIPPALSEIILKLMAKNPENRYQSTFGLMKDLEKCVDSLSNIGVIKNFELGQEDFSGRLQIPEKLYGREQDRSILLEAFDRVKNGSLELTIVAGYSGTGKSVLISETHRPLTATKGYFIEGKFDQFQRNVPFFAWIQAFKNFADLLLTENEDTLKYWKNTILEAAGNNGAVLTEVIPNLEFIIGKQPELEKIGGQEAQNRFNYVMQNFVKAITTPEHPLIIFIDDLQWADLASLNLLKTLVTDTENTHLLCVGAYRDNEVPATHPLVNTLKEIEEQTQNINHLSIGNLNKEAVLHLLADTLKYTQSNELENLSLKHLNQAILSKTGGNAFFTHQFIKSLYEDELLQYSFKNKQWQWDIDTIQKAGFTDNVVELMVKKVKRLPNITKKLLELAACIGNKFASKTLRIISGWQAIHKDLDKAILEGLLIPLGNRQYKFVHDRIQQAAYSLIPTTDKQQTHLEIGQLLYKSLDEKALAENIFDIAGHYNFAKELFGEEDRKVALALNQQAALKAKMSASFDGMLNYISEAREYLATNSWDEDYQLTFTIYKALAEATFLNNQFETSEIIIKEAYHHIENPYDKAELSLIYCEQKLSLAKYNEAIDIIFDSLRDLGIVIPDDDQIMRQGQVITRKILAHLTENPDFSVEILSKDLETDRELNLTLELLTRLGDASYISVRIDLFMFSAAKSVEFSLANKNLHFTPLAFSLFSMVVSTIGHYDLAYQVSQLGLDLGDTLQNKSIATRSLFIMGSFIQSWVKPLDDSYQYFLRGIQLGDEIGEKQYSAYSTLMLIVNHYCSSKNLPQTREEIKYKYWDSLDKKGQFLASAISSVILWHTERLIDNKLSKLYIQKEEFSEEQLIGFSKENALGLVLLLHYVGKIEYNFITNNLEEAQQDFIEMQGVLSSGMSTVFSSSYHYYGCLIALQNNVQPSSKIDNQIHGLMSQLKIWAESCPENFLHKYQLVETEKARVDNKNWYEIIELYEQAIQNAKQNGFIQDAALANELCAKYLISIQKQKIALPYLKEAYNLYKRWGATVKTAQMKQQYPQYLTKQKKTNLTASYADYHTINSITTTKRGLDLDTVLRANASLSKQVRLEDLIQEMLGLLSKNSGANKITFLRIEGGSWLVETDQENEQQLLEHAVALEQYTNLPQQVITFALRSKDIVLSDHLADEVQFQKDDYVKRKQSKSALVVPIKRKEEVMALLYLENNLNTGVFHKKRVELIKALVTQLAISLENTLLYENLEDKVEIRTRELQESNEELRQTQEELKSQRDYIAEKNKVLEEFNIKINGSLKVAQAIQEALLPYQEKLDTLLKNYFIINRPKDTVSGNFYWLNESEGKTILVVADCTQHGIQGAFMTLIGANLLDQIIRLRQITQPADILAQLHEEIKLVIKQGYTSNNQGMDAVVITLEPYNEGTQITFAGAKNNLFFALNQELHELIGTQKSIGGFEDEITQFSNQQVHLPLGSTLYLGSDGLETQDNPERKKFGRERLKDLLSDLKDLPLHNQKVSIEKILDDYMQGAEQRDDILWMGVRV